MPIVPMWRQGESLKFTSLLSIWASKDSGPKAERPGPGAYGGGGYIVSGSASRQLLEGTVGFLLKLVLMIYVAYRSVFHTLGHTEARV